MLVYEPSKRISARAALSHPFFNSLREAKRAGAIVPEFVGEHKNEPSNVAQPTVDGIKLPLLHTNGATHRGANGVTRGSTHVSANGEGSGISGSHTSPTKSIRREGQPIGPQGPQQVVVPSVPVQARLPTGPALPDIRRQPNQSGPHYFGGMGGHQMPQNAAAAATHGVSSGRLSGSSFVGTSVR
jgi:hypothetical protein